MNDVSAVQHYVVEIDAVQYSEHTCFVDAIKAGLLRHEQNPDFKRRARHNLTAWLSAQSDRLAQCTRSDGLQVVCCLFSAFSNDVVRHALALDEGAHPRSFHRTNVNENVPRTITRGDEAKALLVVKELHRTSSHISSPRKTAF